MSAKIILKKSKYVRNKHPYIFQKAIKNYSPLESEKVYELLDEKNNFLGYAIPVNGDVLKAVVIEFNKEDIFSKNYWFDKLSSIWERKVKLPYFKYTEGFRFLFAESDKVPGTIIDIYKNTAVISYKYESMKIFQDFFIEFLTEKGIKNIILKSGTESFALLGKLENVIFKESDINFISFINGGQKTGFFLDQYINRRIFSEFVEKKKVLNIFSYTGAFSFYALKRGADYVHSVDSSKKAIGILNEQFSINKLDKNKHKSFVYDAFKFLKEHSEKYDIIVLDPPAFSKHKKTLEKALIAYKRINKLALKLLNRGGFLVTFSCSQVVSEAEFYSSVFKALRELGLNYSIIHYLHQSPDHTISNDFPEGKYLKGLILNIY